MAAWKAVTRLRVKCAVTPGLEPGTRSLTGHCSTIELGYSELDSNHPMSRPKQGVDRPGFSDQKMESDSKSYTYTYIHTYTEEEKIFISHND